MMKYITGGLAVLGTMAFLFAILWGIAEGKWMKEPDRYAIGTCLKLSFPGTESWESDIIGQIQTVGKNSYEMKHWIEFGWSHTSGTWPFTVEVAKVECPKETYEDGAR